MSLTKSYINQPKEASNYLITISKIYAHNGDLINA